MVIFARSPQSLPSLLILAVVGAVAELLLLFPIVHCSAPQPIAASTTTTTSSNHQSNNNIKCVQWHDYSEQAFNKTLLVRTQHQVACRVRLERQQSGLLDEDVADSSKEHHRHYYYYEFGTMDLSSSANETTSSPLCVLHAVREDPSRQQQQRQHEKFQIAVRNEAQCGQFYWAPLAFDVDPLGPNIISVMERADSAPESPDIAICKYKVHDEHNDNNNNGQEVIGRMFLQGNLFGHCGYLQSLSNDDDNDRKLEVFVGGNFHVLSAIPQQEMAQHRDNNDDDDDDGNARYHLVDEIEKRVNLYLSKEDKNLIASISGHIVEELLDDLNNANIITSNELARILSMDRFLPHDVLNPKGLHLLRAVLAEKMIAARRRHLGLHRHADTVEWERDGVLLKDFDYYTAEHNQQEFEELLQMVAASKTSVSVANFVWVERNVTSVESDPQREPHIDTFHSVVKMWVYERGVVTKLSGPLHFMKGSHRNSRSKLQWMYNVSLPPATDAIQEPSLRFRGDATQMSDILRPVLPLDCYDRTLVIADTSGIHHRGKAPPGTVRKTIRLSSGNDGGLPRLNPYFWDGWDDQLPTTTRNADEKAECAAF